MFDLHCHILPGVDDGPQTLEEALAVARLCVQDGITHIVATPHCHRHLRLMRADIVPDVEQFNRELARAGLPLNILPGSEIQVNDVTTYRREYAAGVYCHLGDEPGYTLLEVPWQDRFYPSGVSELVGWLGEQGTQVILAHPERYDFFQRDPARLRALAEAGAWLQITVDSLLGNHGSLPQAQGQELMHTYPDVVLATDTHNPRRCSGLSAGYQFVREHFGKARSDDLQVRANSILRHVLAARGERPAG